MAVKIPAVFMRGGTSKAVFFHVNNLPKDKAARDRLIQTAYGSPDPYGRQIDGMGGATSVTSKVAIIDPAGNAEWDVNYTFGQVVIEIPQIDYTGNCGNIAAAVGPFAIDQGLVKVEEPITRVRIMQTNSNKEIIAEVPVRNGRHEEEGDYEIHGVPGSGAKITLHFMEPAGSITDSLLPTGNATDILEVQNVGRITVSIVDAADPVVFVRAKDLKMNGTEIDEIDESMEIQQKLEAIRSAGSVVLGLASTPEEASQTNQVLPKIALVCEPKDFVNTSGKIIKKETIDFVARIMSMGKLHRSYSITGAICTAGAARVEGTVVFEMLRGLRDELRIGHPSGIINVVAKVEKEKNSFSYREAVIGRTARRLMEGYVCVPKRCLSPDYRP